MKQRIVIQVQMNSNKSRSKALGLIASTHGVQSVAIEGRERNHLVVVGDGLDAVSLTSYLRKKVGSAQIIQVEVVGGGGAEKTTRTATTASAVAAAPQQWQPRYSSYYYSRPAAVHPYAVAGGHYCYEDSRSDVDSSCAIM
ncbi:hypothetical protein BS78_06G128200 [Paspalum vaginatum]|nr:hypothetical protein BS78_06G128200 [Paspalum vaginatum]